MFEAPNTGPGGQRLPELAELSATQEDYLEAISRLTATKGAARVRDIALELDVHKSTVTAALKGLAEKDLINYAPYELTTLTEVGRRIAQEVTRRHRGIREFLVDVLCIDEATADDCACRLEHVVGKTVFQRLALFAEFVKTSPPPGDDWTEQFRRYIHDGAPADDTSEEGS
jgi:DtxR family transcriptional regulator, Mn-dependent transcriptional regulator